MGLRLECKCSTISIDSFSGACSICKRPKKYIMANYPSKLRDLNRVFKVGFSGKFESLDAEDLGLTEDEYENMLDENYDEYYDIKVEIKDYRILIDGKNISFVVDAEPIEPLPIWFAELEPKLYQKVFNLWFTNVELEHLEVI